MLPLILKPNFTLIKSFYNSLNIVRINIFLILRIYFFPHIIIDTFQLILSLISLQYNFIVIKHFRLYFPIFLYLFRMVFWDKCFITFELGGSGFFDCFYLELLLLHFALGFWLYFWFVLLALVNHLIAILIIPLLLLLLFLFLFLLLHLLLLLLHNLLFHLILLRHITILQCNHSTLIQPYLKKDIKIFFLRFCCCGFEVAYVWTVWVE